MIPAVSVVMPAYNAGPYVRAAVESILNQSLREFELIIINDGSRDDTASVCEALAALDSRVILINQHNQGIAAALNRGVQIARAPFIARMDSDDLSLPHRLECQVEHLTGHPSIDLLSSAFVPFDDFSAPAQVPVHLPTEHTSIYATLAFCSPICHPAVMARRELFERFSYRSGVVAEDHDLWCRAIHHFQFANLIEPLLFYRRHEGSATLRKARQIKFSTLRSGLLHMSRDPLAYRRACQATLKLDRSNYPAINWRWMDRINRVLGIG